MKPKQLLTILTAAVLLLAAGAGSWHWRNANAEAGYGPLSPRGGFGKAVSGTWLVSWAFGEDLSGRAIVTFSADGQFASSNTHQFVVVADATTEERGTWVQTGERSLQTTSLKFSLLGLEDGTRVTDWLIRIRHRMEVNETLDEVTGTVELDYFLPDADLRWDAPLFTVTGGVLEGVRVAVVD